MQSDLEDSGSLVLLARLEQQRAGAVAEDHRDVASGGADVETGRMDLAAHDQHASIAPGHDQRIRHLEGEEKAAALGAEIDAGDLAGVDGLVEEERGSGEVVLGGERRQQDAIDVAHLEVGLLERRECRFAGEVRGLLAGLHPASLANAGALLDPLLGRVHPLRQVRIGDDAIGHAHARADDS